MIEAYETCIFKGKHIYSEIPKKYYKPLINFLKENLNNEREMINNKTYIKWLNLQLNFLLFLTFYINYYIIYE